MKGITLIWDMDRGDLCFSVLDGITDHGKRAGGNLHVGWISLDNIAENGMQWHPGGEKVEGDEERRLEGTYICLNTLLDDIAKTLLAEEIRNVNPAKDAKRKSDAILGTLKGPENTPEENEQEYEMEMKWSPYEPNYIEEWLMTLPEKTRHDHIPTDQEMSQRANSEDNADSEE